MGIKKIIKESIDDFEWAVNTPPQPSYHRDINDTQLYVGDTVKVIDPNSEFEGGIYQIERLMGPDDGWDEGGSELSYGHCGTQENGGCITSSSCSFISVLLVLLGCRLLSRMLLSGSNHQQWSSLFAR